VAAPKEESARKPWFEVAFGELYPVVYSHRDDAAASDEMAFAARMLALAPGERVLDVGCGNGRHLRALAGRGLHAFGLDLSQELLRQVGDGERVARGDMRALPFEDDAFHACLSLFTSFGYFETDAADARVLTEIARVLRPGGRYLIDYLDAKAVVAGIVPHTERSSGEQRILEERTIQDGRVKKRVRITGPSREPVEYQESVRLYTAAELEGMLAAAGLSVRGAWGSLDGRPAGQGDRCVIAAEKT